MNAGSGISPELLSAYVDGELDAAERQYVEHAMQEDEQLRQRVDELRKLKRMVRDAYVEETASGGAGLSSGLRQPWRLPAWAASVAAFALGAVVSGGWLAHTDGSPRPQAASVAGQSDTGAAQQEQAVKVVFHVSRDSPRQLDAILTEAEALLSTTARGGRTASVRIIASGDGLSLFQAGETGAAARIRELKQAYQGNLVFNGCGLAYEELKGRTPDGDPELLPELQLVELGILELMRRQREGWAYIRV